MNKNPVFYVVVMLALIGCSEKKNHIQPKDPQKAFIVSHNIVQASTFESACTGGEEQLLSNALYNSAGEEVDSESFIKGERFTKTTQVYENGLLAEKTYHPIDSTQEPIVVKYAYNEQGQRIKYVISDAHGNRISLHKIERRGRVENISDYNARGNLTDYQTVIYDSLNNPLVSGARKFRYTYNSNGMITESASVDTTNGSFVRKTYEYRGLLPVKQTVYYGDSCHSVIRYQYQKASGEQW